MTIIEIKNHILENEKIEFILKEIKCHDIKYHKKGYYTFSNSDGDNKNAVILYNDESLKCINYTRNMNDNKCSDLITLVGFNMNLSFIDSLKFLHKILKLDFKFQTKNIEINKKDPLEIFKKIKRKRHTISEDIEIYDDSIIKEYIQLPHIDWIREDGIMPFTCNKFKIGYSADRKRIIIPHRWWCGDENDFVGIMGRTTIKEWKLLDIPKYLPLKAFPKSMNIYGLQENYQTIQEAGYCVVYEAEKSTLKRHSRNDGTGVAVCCHDVSDEQVKILIGLNVDVVIAFDKGISIEHIRSTCDRFYGVRTVYYIFDKYDILEDKMSPADATNKIFNYLLKYKTLYDEKERRKHLEWLEKLEKN